MKESFTSVGIGRLCGLFGKTRHAYYNRISSTGPCPRQKIVAVKTIAIISVSFFIV